VSAVDKVEGALRGRSRPTALGCSRPWRDTRRDWLHRQ